jgi:hypothetical protein
MTLSNQAVAEAFSRQDFEVVYPRLAEDVRWNLIGGDQLAGSDQVIRKCDELAEYLATVVTTFGSFKVVRADEHVVVECVADYVEGEGQSSRIASCDIYRFTGDMIREITSYNVELAKD